MAGPVRVQALNCPNCGAALVLRSFQHTLSVVCPQCLSVLDAKDPNHRVLQQFEARQRIAPLIPLGTRGKWHGETYEVVGFQVRTIRVEGEEYSWREYLLLNPYHGFRYLTEYDGHWNDVRTVRRRVVPGRVIKSRQSSRYEGRDYAHFSTALAETTYVLGEFPWQVRVGEQVNVRDYIAPPWMLSGEQTEDEVVWSLAEYTDGKAIWEAFSVPGRPPEQRGIFANQPSPHGKSASGLLRACAFLLLIAFVMTLAFYTFTRQQEVFRQNYRWWRGQGGEPSFVTNVFDLRGRTSSVEVAVNTDLSNHWAYFNFALINDETGEAYDFGREVSYYFGRDSDGSWTEGGRSDRALIPSVPQGRYYLRVEPEVDPALASMAYELRVRRDVPTASLFMIAAALLAVPPAFSLVRRLSFESERWKESNYSATWKEED